MLFIQKTIFGSKHKKYALHNMFSNACNINICIRTYWCDEFFYGKNFDCPLNATTNKSKNLLLNAQKIPKIRKTSNSTQIPVTHNITCTMSKILTQHRGNSWGSLWVWFKLTPLRCLTRPAPPLTSRTCEFICINDHSFHIWLISVCTDIFERFCFWVI